MNSVSNSASEQEANQRVVSPARVALFIALLLISIYAALGQDSVMIRVSADETQAPLPGLKVAVTLVPSKARMMGVTDAAGLARFAIKAHEQFTVDVQGIRIRNASDEVFVVPASGQLPTIQVELSRTDLREAESADRYNEDLAQRLKALKNRVNRSDVYRTVRGYLDTLFADEVVSGDTLLITPQKTGVVVTRVADQDGFVYFNGVEIGMNQGESYTVSCTDFSGVSGGVGTGVFKRMFAYKGSELPQEWAGDFPYTLVPVISNRLSELRFDQKNTLISIGEKLDRELRVLAAFVRKQNVKIELQGHSNRDPKVKDEGQALQLSRTESQRRAEAIVQLLVSKYGVAPELIKAVGYGHEFPITSNAVKAGADNSRIIVKVRKR